MGILAITLACAGLFGQAAPADTPLTHAQLRRTQVEIESLFSALKAGGVAAREITSVADIRGFRLLRRKRYREAQLWFEAGVKNDPTYELCLFNAALTAHLLADHPRVHKHTVALQKLHTPLANAKLAILKKTVPSP